MLQQLFDLSGRVALVTGASRGLGQYMAKALARAGADIAITSRDQARLAETEEDILDIGRRVLSVELDVLNLSSIQSAVQDVEAHFGRLDVLVNNAGCNVRRRALEVTAEDWDKVVNTNLRGAFFVAQAAARIMKAQRWGRVINIGSVTCVSGYAGMGPYCASRGGIKQLTMSLAHDWAEYGITVNCLAPGWFKTEQSRMLYEDETWLSMLKERIPMARPGRPDDLDGMVVFLASESSRYITGQTYLVDGGVSIGAIRAMPQSELG
ncbi:MAG: glucose 1-dehydrogenase [Rhodothermaceae bacterium]|nr:glucose 1-dehydrogenase [Bacteroidota bacterium]MXW81987.1 glucose 1-dehydrogenase [Rhodothermaceae bacterium]MDE2672509.1 glucose 1-dehydrogenase [Bacteroidota bacterium]MXX59330.1 glucose 1-dehydrogenase [Rhodothermaceae bacterium]MXZ05064.1 glucose 1-dehydrogenase [Rhodothermaceae bacterium]